MTDIPDTTTLKRLLDTATTGPWQISGGRGHERSLYGHDVGPDGAPVALVDYPPPGRHVADDIHFRCRANARLIALAPSLAARVIELEAEVANLRDAFHAATDPDFIWGAMDNVFDMDSELDDLAAAASRAIRAALGDRT